ncbi:MAG: phosphate acyltransferase [Gammaproteobacteria bacterium RIFCSPHIGHO2_02_FULL_39_13]|nr:MAG: phosphate acyltransferase [Gammaproteobacteria bacterium RIFCSPHIGHO2_02_FULL_39_13]OGT48728.1 MAG: phosphate acyltransferase [Gammaproteobacteria bacterium RIFCSPHIGHO2_12_FULL_39_24]
MKTISIDVMGGDHGSRVTVPAALSVLKKHPDLKLIFVGLVDQLQPELSKADSALKNRFEIQSASEVVMMDESPAVALRSKKDSSMRIAINAVKEGRAQACVSAGNTGALMATARFVLKTLPSIDRPAILARFPTMSGRDVRVLDLGANVDSTPEHLFQFAVMGSVVAKSVDNVPHPSVGLLNVGSEDIKGNEQVKNAAQLLSQCKEINYVGFVEGDDIFRGNTDVVVCDGFVGNSVLKACEGTLRLIAEFTKQEIKKNWLTQLSVLPAMLVLNRLKNRIDPRKKNGATFLGLNGVVIKSHGGADQFAFACAIEQAIMEIEKNVPGLIREQVGNILSRSGSE